MNGVVGVGRDVVDRLTPVPATVRQQYLALPATQEAHAAAHAEVAALHQIELVQDAPAVSHRVKLRVAAWNLERCLYPEESARILARHGVDLALLTEMDVGVLRTGLVHTIGRVASQLGQGYCYGLEFLELMSPPPPAGFPRHGEANTEGFHGNGIVTSLPIEQPVVIRLDEQADWFAATRDNQRRIGNRMAVAATFSVGGSKFVACSVHLENRTDGTGRAAQMRTLLNALDAYAGSLPVLVGGDLNTHVAPGGTTDASEPLFEMTSARGYDWSACNLACSTTRQSTWSQSEGTRQLDWFCTRDLTASDPNVIPAIGEDGEVLSDHEMLLLTLRLG
ncbi:MAG TPA: endonuclease/exonuclease/phosphatase family protein [Acetobacteraceae bacterium]|nr:endonuclease/exonuclease/phosphatase family protein [Acetobacteraceae bacterium]